ncbi:MAG: sugar transferase [Candidatus Omnitrophota bacterium]|nr:MAG: sugar transferase [Candidatus Omnitrophota bacterium]
MHKEIRYFYRKINILGDALIAAVAFLAAMYLKAYFDTGFWILPEHFLQYFWLFYVVVALWPLLLNLNGLYPTNRLRTIRSAVKIIIQSSFQGALIIFAILFALKMHHVSRAIIAGFVVIATLLLIVKESAVIISLYVTRKKGAGLKNVLVVGTLESGREIAKKIEAHPFLGLNVAGILITQKEIQEGVKLDKEIKGALEDIEMVLHYNPIDIALITIDRKDYQEVDEVIFRCIEEGVEIWLRPTPFTSTAIALDADEILGIPLFIFRMGPKFSWGLFTKTVIDKVGAFILSMLTLPVIGLSAVAIKITSSGPALFKQRRCTLQGRIFALYKLRTMYEGAEKMLEELRENNVMRGPVFKMENDPRITPVGRFLRKLSIDEIPQFWNVFKGDMSLIGPRPPIPKEVEGYKGWQRRRLSMRPGITGLWQVSGRSDITDFEKLAVLDLKYIDNWSPWLDIKIFFKTIWVVLSCQGAK